MKEKMQSMFSSVMLLAMGSWSLTRIWTKAGDKHDGPCPFIKVNSIGTIIIQHGCTADGIEKRRFMMTLKK